MRLRPIVKQIWEIYAPCVGHGDDVTIVAALGDETFSQMVALLDHVARAPQGPRCLPNNRNHAICADPKILQMSFGGTQRLAYFYDEQKLIIVAHLYKKSGGSGKVKSSDLNVAVRRHRAYFDAKATGKLEFLPEDES